MPRRRSKDVIVGRAVLVALLMTATGCHSPPPLKTIGGDGSAGSPGVGGTSGSGSSVGGRAGRTGGTGGSWDAGRDGPAAASCETDQDCAFKPELSGCICSTQTCQCKALDGGADELACLQLFHSCTVDSECCAPNRCLNVTGTAQCQQEGPASTSVTLRLVLAAGQSFCDDGCGGGPIIAVLDKTGQTIITNGPFCHVSCSPCGVAPPCYAKPCSALPATHNFTWDGTSAEPSTCGDQVACVLPEVAPPGHYVARMCATPGNLTSAAGLPPTCTATGPTECDYVPFDFPGPSPVVGTLP